jgi:hypothetical protein
VTTCPEERGPAPGRLSPTLSLPRSAGEDWGEGHKSKGETMSRRYNIPKALLEKIYLEDGMTQAEIAAQIGCDPSTIGRQMRAYGIPVRPPTEAGGKIDIPKSVLQKMYRDDGMTQEEIAAHFGCTDNVISQRMQEYGIPARFSNAPVKLPRDELHRLYIVEGLTTTAIAAHFKCGSIAVIKT